MWVRVKGQIRIPEKGRWAHNNVKLLHYLNVLRIVVQENYHDEFSCFSLEHLFCPFFVVYHTSSLSRKAQKEKAISSQKHSWMLILMSHHANSTLEINVINLQTADLWLCRLREWLLPCRRISSLGFSVPVDPTAGQTATLSIYKVRGLQFVSWLH